MTYKDVEGNEYSATKTITRHITGLPYVAAPPKDNGDNPWTSNYAVLLNHVTFSADNVALSAASRAPAITSPAFHIPEKLDVTVNTNHSLANAYIFFGERKTVFEVAANNETIISNGDECTKLAHVRQRQSRPARQRKALPCRQHGHLQKHLHHGRPVRHDLLRRHQLPIANTDSERSHAECLRSTCAHFGTT